jgi:hypothetical protein
MTKEILYLYLGTNGSILSPVHLEDTYYVRRVRLVADDEKALTKDGVNFVRSTIVAEDEVELWKEV